jgi:hypothetical protein
MEPCEIDGQVQKELGAAIIRNVRYLSDIGYSIHDWAKISSRQLFDRSCDARISDTDP